MTAVSHHLHRNGATGRRTATSREYEALYVVRCDNLGDGPQIVLDYADANLPNPYDKTAYAFQNDIDTLALCSEVEYRGRVKESGFLHEVACRFTTDESTSGSSGIDTEGNPTSNPLEFRPDIVTSYQMVRRPVYLCKYRGGYTGAMAELIAPGEDMVPMSSAYGVFDPPLERDVFLQKITITQNVQFFDNTDANKFIGTVNNADGSLVSLSDIGYGNLIWLLEIAKGTCRIQDYRPQLARETVKIDGVDVKIDYLKVAVDLLIDPEGWLVETPDIDWHRRANPGDPDGRGGTLSIVDRVDGMAFDEPLRGPSGDLAVRKVLLDGDGQPLDVQTAENAVMLKWELYKERGLFAVAPIVRDLFE